MTQYPDLQLYIGGAWIEPSSDSRIEVITPATEEPFVIVAEAQEADIHRAVHAAEQEYRRKARIGRCRKRTTMDLRIRYLNHV